MEIVFFFHKKGDERLAYAPVNPQSEIISFKYLFNSQNKYQSSDFADSFFARISRNSPLYLFRLLWGLLIPSYIHLCSLVNILTCQTKVSSFVLGPRDFHNMSCFSQPLQHYSQQQSFTTGRISTG